MTPEHIVAIDLGTTKVVSIVGEKTQNGYYRIVAYNEAPSVGVRRGQVEHIQKVTNAVIPTLEAIRAETGIDITEVYVGIAGQYIMCIENKVETIRDKYEEMISKEEIEKLEENAGKLHLSPTAEILHVVPQNYSVDDKSGITDPIGRLGSKLTGHFYVIAGNKSTRIHTEACMRELKLSLQQLILEPIASARAILSDEEKEAGVAMIDIGGGTTDLIIYKEHTLMHTVVIPFGGNVITEDIKTVCGILYNQAEALKIKFGMLENTADYVKIDGISGHAPRKISLNTVRNIISSRVSEIIDMVLSEIIKTKCEKLGAGLVITGGVSKMKGIKQFLENKLRTDAKNNPELSKKMNIEVTLGNPKFVSESDENIIHPKYATAVGLIMCGFDHLEKKTVYPPSLPNKPDKSETADKPDKPETPDSPVKKSWLQDIGEEIRDFFNPKQEQI